MQLMKLKDVTLLNTKQINNSVKFIFIVKRNP